MSDLFNETIKAYYHRESNQIDLSFRVSPSYVQTFYLTREEFEKILDQAPREGGYNRPGLFVLLKHTYLRWTFDTPGMAHQIRVTRAKWNELVLDYKRKMSDQTSAHVTFIAP